ncbi:MAG: hypothetical protein Q8N47_25345 [Bryobacterales bacterium]|nr:hypothetical protein [Bryobacterales bacterium]
MKCTQVLSLLLLSLPLSAQIPPGVIDTVAGTGNYGFSGDRGAAVRAQIDAVFAVAADSQGSFYFADCWNHRVRKVTADGIVTTVAGTGEEGYSGDGGPATAARLAYPRGLATDLQDNLYISDSANSSIRKLTLRDGTISTVAGSSVPGYFGDGGRATAARLRYPRGIAIDPAGNLVIADSLNQRVRKVTPAGIISTVAGSGLSASSGDGGPATRAGLGVVQAVAADFQGNLFLSDATNHNIRKVAPNGIITTVAGGNYGTSSDETSAISARFRYPRGLAVDGDGNLFVADSLNHRIRKITPNGSVGSVAGTGPAGFSGDRGDARLAQFNAPYDLAVDPTGALLIADAGNYRVRKAMVGAAARPAILPGGIVNAASNQGAPVAPGEIVSIYGFRIGPATPSTLRLASNGRVDTTLAETRVLFDGVPAPLLMVSAGQANVAVPYAVSGRSSASVQIEYKGVSSAAISVPVTASAPALFTADASGQGQGAILNEDYSPNSPSNPARKGSVVMLFATGEGATNPAGVDGRVASAPLPAPLLPVAVGINNAGAELIYAGAAPGMVAGLMQINVRVPADAPSGSAVPVSIKVGNAFSQDGVTLAIR